MSAGCVRYSSYFQNNGGRGNVDVAVESVDVTGIDYPILDYPLQSDIDYTDNEIDQIIAFICTEGVYEQIKKGLFASPRRTVNRKRLSTWIAQQPNPWFKKAAGTFARRIVYISYERLIRTLERTSDALLPGYHNSVICTGNYGKSSHFFSVVVAAYMYSRHRLLPKAFSKNFMFAFRIHGYDATYLDIDDMMYTGSQTIDLMFRYNDGLKFGFNLEKKTNRDKAVILGVNRRYLQARGLKYKLVRLYVCQDAIRMLQRCEPVIIPYELVHLTSPIPSFGDMYHSPDIETVLDYMIIKLFFNLNVGSSSCAYFDYKVAQIVSTTSFPLVTGYIPSTDFINQCLEHLDDVEGYFAPRKNRSEIIQSFKERLVTSIYRPVKFIPFVNNLRPRKDFIENFNELEFQSTYGGLNFGEGDSVDASDLDEIFTPKFHKIYMVLPDFTHSYLDVVNV